jgi:polyisoprenoid-binding protein YceI
MRRRPFLFMFDQKLNNKNSIKKRKNKMTTWKIDPAHSEINFKVKHMLVSAVRGHFDKFTASIETSKDDFSDAKIRFEADVNSINTNNEQRDAHLMSADFFDADNNPKLVFESTSVKSLSDYEMKVTGNLTIRGITREITLNVIYNGTVAGFGDTKVAGFEVRGTINRFDHGLKWNALTEAGGVVVSNEVKIEILAEFNEVSSVVKAA